MALCSAADGTVLTLFPRVFHFLFDSTHRSVAPSVESEHCLLVTHDINANLDEICYSLEILSIMVNVRQCISRREYESMRYQ